MDLAQPYLPNAYSWNPWTASDGHIPVRKKRLRLDVTNHENLNKYDSEAEQQWNVEEFNNELPISRLDNGAVEMQPNYHIEDEFLTFDSYGNFKQEISASSNFCDDQVSRQLPSVENIQKKYDRFEQFTAEREFAVSKLESPVSSSLQSCFSDNDVQNKIGKKTQNDDQAFSEENIVCNAESCVVNPLGSVTSDMSDESFRFQYVLCAATSIAMKINEETLTYLNQGQPYEIRLKKLGDLTHSRGKIFKSIIRVLFHDRRLQFTERQQMSAWQASRPGDRILQLDLPLSYGISEHIEDSNALNSVQFLWDPTKDIGVYIKVNCISTEFTAKKHGGEKGAPLRIQIETYSHEKNPRSLHMASCQIKVFKLKGADRKHKQDREKIMKKSPSERENYQNSCDCTVFTDMFLNGDPLSPYTTNSSVTFSPGNTDSDGGHTNNSVLSTVDYDSNLNDTIADSVSQNANFTLTKESSVVEMQYWLRCNRFGSYINKFENFTVADMLSLSRDDFIQICGIPDGIRLYNSLPIISKLTIYVSIDTNSNIYHPIYLKSLTCQELIGKVAQLMGSNVSQISTGFILGPHNSQIIITDDLVQNMKEETLFFAEFCKEAGNLPRKKLFLKPMSPVNNNSSH